MVAEAVTVTSALAYTAGVVTYVVLSWALVQLGWKFVQYRTTKAAERQRAQADVDV